MAGLTSLLSAFGLSTAVGLNAYLPLLVVGLLARYTNLIHLNEPYSLLSNPVVLLVIAVLALLDFVGDKIPAVDHALHAAGLIINSASINGNARTFSQAGDMMFIPVCQGLDCPPHGAGDPLQVQVNYSAATTQVGFYYYPRNSYTLAEPYDGRYWWPSYDLPFDKATVDVYATVPDSNICLSNGDLISAGSSNPGFITYHWQMNHPISTYLVARTFSQPNSLRFPA